MIQADFRPTPRLWVLVTVSVALVLASALTVTHFNQTGTLVKTTEALERFRDSHIEFTRGFLFVNLAGLPGTPYDRAQGLALLDQAEESLRTFHDLWSGPFPEERTLDALLEDFHIQNRRLKDLLSIGYSTELRVAYFELERISERIERIAHEELSGLLARLDRDFLGTMALALTLLLALAATLYTVTRERNKAENRLSQVTRELRLGLWHRDLTTGKTDVNVEWKRLLGQPDDMGVPDQEAWGRLIHPEDRESFFDEIKQFMASGRNNFTGSYRVTHPDGSVHWIQTLVTLVRDSKGKPVAQNGCNLDITETRQLQAERESLQAQVAQTQKTEAIGRLAGGIAHDLNNLLVPLLTYSDLGLQGSAARPPAHYFRKIREAGTRAAALTRQILAFSRQQILEKKDVDLNALVTGFESILRRLIREDIGFDVSLSPGLPAILADPGQVEQVILNLVVNARDAMPKGGVLGLSTSYQVLDDAFVSTHFEAVPGAYVVLTVSDTGVGMTAEVIDRIFEPFFTTKPRGEGTGLGLATVHGIVKQHGGQVGVESDPGKGSVFRISWPVSTSPRTEAKEAEFHEVRGGKESLLVVEDEEIVREVVTESLESQGYRVLAVATPDAARQLREPFELLVTDVVMPEQNGKELWEALRETRPKLKVLFISGYTDRILSGTDRDGPGHGFLQKPFAVDVLCRKVRELLDGPPP